MEIPIEKKDNHIISARFIMAIGFSLTYCLIMIASTIALLYKILTVETFVALLGAFALVVREIVSDYFKRKRPEDNGLGLDK